MRREDPGRVVNAPNYRHWLSHQKRHGLPPELLASCNGQLDMPGVHVFSRNIDCHQRRCWFGGLSSEDASTFKSLRSPLCVPFPMAPSHASRFCSADI